MGGFLEFFPHLAITIPRGIKYSASIIGFLGRDLSTLSTLVLRFLAWFKEVFMDAIIAVLVILGVAIFLAWGIGHLPQVRFVDSEEGTEDDSTE